MDSDVIPMPYVPGIPEDAFVDKKYLDNDGPEQLMNLAAKLWTLMGEGEVHIDLIVLFSQFLRRSWYNFEWAREAIYELRSPPEAPSLPNYQQDLLMENTRTMRTTWRDTMQSIGQNSIPEPLTHNQTGRTEELSEGEYHRALLMLLRDPVELTETQSHFIADMKRGREQFGRDHGRRPNVAEVLEKMGNHFQIPRARSSDELESDFTYIQQGQLSTQYAPNLQPESVQSHQMSSTQNVPKPSTPQNFGNAAQLLQSPANLSSKTLVNSPTLSTIRRVQSNNSTITNLSQPRVNELNVMAPAFRPPTNYSAPISPAAYYVSPEAMRLACQESRGSAWQTAAQQQEQSNVRRQHSSSDQDITLDNTQTIDFYQATVRSPPTPSRAAKSTKNQRSFNNHTVSDHDAAAAENLALGSPNRGAAQRSSRSRGRARGRGRCRAGRGSENSRPVDNSDGAPNERGSTEYRPRRSRGGRVSYQHRREGTSSSSRGTSYENARYTHWRTSRDSTEGNDSDFHLIGTQASVSAPEQHPMISSIQKSDEIPQTNKHAPFAGKGGTKTHHPSKKAADQVPKMSDRPLSNDKTTIPKSSRQSDLPSIADGSTQADRTGSRASKPFKMGFGSASSGDKVMTPASPLKPESPDLAQTKKAVASNGAIRKPTWAQIASQAHKNGTTAPKSQDKTNDEPSNKIVEQQIKQENEPASAKKVQEEHKEPSGQMKTSVVLNAESSQVTCIENNPTVPHPEPGENPGTAITANVEMHSVQSNEPNEGQNKQPISSGPDESPPKEGENDGTVPCNKSPSTSAGEGPSKDPESFSELSSTHTLETTLSLPVTPLTGHVEIPEVRRRVAVRSNSLDGLTKTILDKLLIVEDTQPPNEPEASNSPTGSEEGFQAVSLSPAHTLSPIKVRLPSSTSYPSISPIRKLPAHWNDASIREWNKATQTFHRS